MLNFFCCKDTVFYYNIGGNIWYFMGQYLIKFIKMTLKIHLYNK